MPDDLTPLPAWKQQWARLIAWWKRSKPQRQRRAKVLRNLASRGLILAISVSGAILIAAGVQKIYDPAGYITGGLLCWLLLWSHEKDKEGGR
jgi:hypothetical protein